MPKDNQTSNTAITQDRKPWNAGAIGTGKYKSRPDSWLHTSSILTDSAGTFTISKSNGKSRGDAFEPEGFRQTALDWRADAGLAGYKQPYGVPAWNAGPGAHKRSIFFKMNKILPPKQNVSTPKIQSQVDSDSSITDEKEVEDLVNNDDKEDLTTSTSNVVADDTNRNQNNFSPNFKMDYHYRSVPDTTPHYLPRFIEMLAIEYDIVKQ